MVPRSWMSIDPGDVHVGVAIWEFNQLITGLEFTPREITQALCDSLKHARDLVVCEDFELYAWTSASLSGNKFLTPRLIGVIEYLCEQAGVPLVFQRAREGKRVYKMEPFVNFKGADWKKYCKTTRVPSVHTRDAIMHGLWYQRKQGVTWELP